MNAIFPILLIGFFPILTAQSLPDVTPKTPSAHQFSNHSNNNYGNPAISPLHTTNQNVRNQMLIAEVEKDMKEREMKKKRTQALIKDALQSFFSPYSLPSYSNRKGSKHYVNAIKELNSMDKNSYSLKQAVFTVENAFYEEEMEYEEFENIIHQTGNFLKEKMVEFGYDQNSNVAKNLILFRFFSDTLRIKNKNIKHLPFKYDFEDYMGREDWSKMFVTKLLKTGSGQYHSLPLLYLILAEEIGAIAHLAKSPNHTYIKFPDDDNRNWYNVELTSNFIMSDAFILQSINVEALQNRIYAQALSTSQLMSQLYTDLANGYQAKYGNDEFVNQTINDAIKIDPTNITAHLTKSNFNIEFKDLSIFDQFENKSMNKNSSLLLWLFAGLILGFILSKAYNKRKNKHKLL